jgi:hypothetical protein
MIETQHDVSPLIFNSLRRSILHNFMEFYGADVQCIDMISFREDFNAEKPER